MRFDRDSLFARKRARAAAWLTLLSLALVQLSLASHQHDHSIGDIAESCHACAQLERFDDAASDVAPAAVPAAATRSTLPLLPPVDISLAQTHQFDARGPPRI